MNRIKELRKERGRTQQEIADFLGVTKQSVSGYETGKITPPTDVCERLANLFLVSTDYLIGRTDNPEQVQIKSFPTVRIPVLGRVKAGIPADAITEIIDYEDIPEQLAKSGEFFGLRIRGDSMSPRILNGDTVIVRRQDTADNGDIVIALVNGHDGVCKRLKRFHGGIALISLNPAYEPMVYTHSEIDSVPVIILGRVVELRGKM